MSIEARCQGSLRVGIAGLVFVILSLAGPEAAAGGDTSASAASGGASAAPEAAAADQDGAPPTKPAPEVIEERLHVVGSAERARDLPGSATYIGREELERQAHGDIHRVLRRVPGVYVQEEEGYGLRPNIGLRATGVERSSKVTLLEDGVLIAPAPYSAPAAYYFPTVGRMEGIEVRKGSSSIKQGPYTNGGVINLVSRRIPSEFSGQARVSIGEDALRRVHAWVGDGEGQFSWMAETYRFETDGFKRLDGGGETGVEVQDWLVKLRYTTPASARVAQIFEVKLSRTDQEGDETYLGLAREDFDRTPYRRYAGSQEDRIDTEHEQIQVRWFARFSPSFDVTATAYDNDFFRNWFKLDQVNGVGIAAILDDPATYATEIGILRGQIDSAPDALRNKNNRRNYYGRGVQAIAAWSPATAGASHLVEFGVRVHEDEEDRFQDNEFFQITDGAMTRTSVAAPGSDANRVSSAEAVAFFVHDEIRWNRLMLTPGVRFESIDFERLDYGRNDPDRTGSALVQRENSVDQWIPGVGASYRLDERRRVFGGVHLGFAPPGAGADDRTEAEESINYELGFETAGERLSAQLIAFYNDYDNLLGSDTLSSGGTGSGDLFNGGKVELMGIEATLGTELTRGRASFRLPASLSYTFTRSEFRTSFETDFEDWAPEVTIGDELPYLPEHMLHASLGFERGALALDLSATYVDDMRTKAGQGPIPANEIIEAHTVVDLGARYRLGELFEVFSQVRNVTDEVYVAALRPAGLRPGLPRQWIVGVGVNF